MNIRTDILLRSYISFGVIVLIAIAVLYKMFSVQFIHGEKWREMADSLSTRYIDVEAARGNIFSHDGRLLATSVPEYDIRMDLMAPGITDDQVFYSKVDSLASALSRYFGDRSTAQYGQGLRHARKQGNRYYLVKRDVTYSQMKAMREFPVFNLGYYKGGMIAEQKNKRILPFQDLARRTIGYKNEHVQPVGLEGAYAAYIDGQGGKRLVQRIAGGTWIPVNPEMDIESVAGSDIISTIDVDIQDVAQSVLKEQLIKSNADNGCVVLMEVKTGEVRAIANYSKVSPGKYEEKFNLAIAQRAEPGSTFKLASYLVALKDGKIDTSTLVDTRGGTFTVAGKTIRDDHAGGYGLISVKRAFEVSSNTAVTKLIYQHYKETPAQFTRSLREMHLNDKLGLPIPGEGAPLVKTPESKSWSKLSLTQMAYGYELLLTPLQTLTFYNAVANDGKMIAPVFVKEISHLGKPVKQFKARVIDEHIASLDVIKKAQGMLIGAVEHGTGRFLKNPLFKIAGKTGTAQMADGARGYRGRRRYQASFAGYFPAEQPKYSMIVVIQNPKNGYYAASVAGPVFSEIAEKVYASDAQMYSPIQHLEMASMEAPEVKEGSPDSNQHVFNAFGWKYTYAGDQDQETLPAGDAPDAIYAVQPGIVPDIKGMGLRDALFYLGNAGFKVQIEGASGRVIAQSVQPGTKLTTGSDITIQLQ